MPVTTLKHIIKGTRFEGARDLSTGVMVYYRARQVVFVEGLASGAGAKAVEQARIGLENTFQPSQLDDPEMPGGTGVQMVVDHVDVHLLPCGTQAWAYVTWINPTLKFGLVVDQDLESEFDGGVIAVPWVQLGRDAGSTTAVFSADGRPNGTAWHGMKNPTVKTSEDDAPTIYYRQVPVVNIRVPFNRSVNPIAAVASLQGRVNSGAATWGGYGFPARTLRFNKVVVRTYAGGGTRSFAGFYDFTARPDAWDEQGVEWGSAGPWTVQTAAQCESASFGGGFPAS